MRAECLLNKDTSRKLHEFITLASRSIAYHDGPGALTRQ